MERRATLQRTTGETSITVSLDVDGRGEATINTGVGFFDHLLYALARHGLFNLAVEAKGDLEVDEHHSVEDVAIVLGRAFQQALGERRGIRRIAHAYAPLDEALARAVVDASGRGFAVVQATFSGPRIGSLETHLVQHFLETFAREAGITLHASVLVGENDHHIAEALFKALARALDGATQIDPRLADAVPSTKGTLA